MKKWITIDERRIQKEMDYWNIPGMAIALIQEGVPDQICCFGWRDKERRLEVTENTKFCVASCSKSMTAVLIAALVDEGVLDFDVPVRNYVPEMEMWDAKASREMTLRDMLCHRTGLGGYDIVWPNDEGRGRTAERLRFLKPNEPFRAVSQYSNLIYIMIGYIAERVTGKCWPQLMREYVFDPLGMSRTSCLASEITGDEDHAEPYQVIDGKLTKLPFWNMDMAGPAASVNSTTSDMVRWIRFHIDGGRNQEGKRILSKEVFAQMHEAQIAYDDAGGLDEDYYTCNGYGFGWRVGTYRGIHIQKHSGKIDGYSTFQLYLPDSKTGFFIALNLHSPSNPIFYSVVYSMIDEMFGLESCEWFKRFRDGGDHAAPELFEDCKKDLVRPLMTESKRDVPFEENEIEWVGIYEEPGYGFMKIEEEEENGQKQLYLSYRDQKLRLYHFGEELFWMEGVKADIWTMKVPVTLKKEDGLYLVYVGYEPLTEPARFIKIQ